MVKQVINVGANANDGTGDDLRTAMQKINTNFSELYGTTAEANDLVEDITPQLGGNLDLQNFIITTSLTNGNISLQPNGTGSVLLKNIRITDNVISSDDSTSITINESLVVTGSANFASTLSVPTVVTNVIQSDDSSIIEINNGLQVAGSVKSTSVVTNSLSSEDSTAIQVGDSLNVNGTVTASTVNANTVNTTELNINDNQILAYNSNSDIRLTTSGTGAIDVGGARIKNVAVPTDANDAATKSWVEGYVVAGIFASTITVVGDDSTGTAVSLGETFKIAGTTGITTAMSGDTLTITGPDLTSYAQKTDTAITLVGDDSSGTAVTIGETFKIAGASNITTAVSGDTLTITGPDLSSYVTASSSTAFTNKTGNISQWTNDSGYITASALTGYLTNSTITVVGDDSTGVTLNSGETIKIAGSSNITTAVSGDTLTITGPSLDNIITVVGDDSTGVSLNKGETIKIAGGVGISTAVSGDTITISATGGGGGGSIGDLVIEGQTITTGPTNADLTISPNGVGNINLDADTVRVGDLNTNVTISSNGSADLILTTDVDNPTTGSASLTIENGNLGRFLFDNAENGYVQVGTDYSSLYTQPLTLEWRKFGISSVTEATMNMNKFDVHRIYGNSLAAIITLEGTDPNSTQIGWRAAQVDLFTDLNSYEQTSANTVVVDPTSKGATRNSGGEVRVYTLGPVALGVTNSFRNTSADPSGVEEGAGITSFTEFTHNSNSPFFSGPITVNNYASYTTSVNLGINGGDTNITNLIGYRATGNYVQAGTANVTNYYAFYAHDNSEATNNYGIYVENDSYENYLGGLVVKNSTIAANRSNESLYLSTSGTGKVIVNDSMEVINTLTANTISTNDISSADSSAIQINDSVNISGTLSVDTIDVNNISSGDSSAIQINDSVNISGTLNSATIVNNSISTNEIASADSSAIQINDAVNVSGTFNAKTIVTNDLISEDSSVINVLDGLNVSGNLTSSSVNSDNLTLTGLLTLGSQNVTYLNSVSPATGTVAYCTDEPGGAQTVFYDGTNWRRTSDLAVMGSGGSSTLSTVTLKVNNIESDDSSVIQINDAIEIDGQLNLNSNKIINVQDPTTNQDAATKKYVDDQVIAAGAGTVVSITAGTGLTGGTITTSGTLALDFSTVVARVVGDDSTGTDLRVGETFKIAGGTGISTAISGDTITITNTGGVGGGNGFTVVGDDSTGTLISDGETIKIAGTSGITTSMSGDVLTISGPDLSSYLTSVPKTIDINVISSSDSSAIQVNDSLNVSGTLTAGTIVTSNISAPSSTTGTYTISSPTTITLSPTSEVLNTAPFTLYSRTVAQLASLTASVGAMVYCTNETGGPVPVFFDGTNWRRMTDRNIAS